MGIGLDYVTPSHSILRKDALCQGLGQRKAEIRVAAAVNPPQILVRVKLRCLLATLLASRSPLLDGLARLA